MRHYAVVILATYLGLACAANAVIFLSGPSDFARDIYFAVFILINMGLFTWVHFTARGVIALATTIVCSYAALMIFRHDSLSPQYMAIFCTQMLFIIGSALIGYMSFTLRNRYLLDNARLRRELELDLEHEERERRRSEFEAQHDRLTQLPNRAALESRFLELSEQEPGSATRMALLFIDLDGFKSINDKYGHLFGDEVLTLLARRLGHGLRQRDFVARIGGDEFVALIKLEDDASKTTDIVAGKLTDLIEEPMHLKNINLRVGASIGLAIFPDDGENLSDLMASADARMYTIKRSRER